MSQLLFAPYENTERTLITRFLPFQTTYNDLLDLHYKPGNLSFYYSSANPLQWTIIALFIRLVI